MSSLDISNLVELARLAEMAERYDDMAEAMKEIAKTGHCLAEEERNLLSVAYKNVVGAKRSSWRTIQKLSVTYNTAGDERANMAEKYTAKIEKELREVCDAVLELLTNLIPTEESCEAQVFYLKMKGDYYRYIAEFVKGSERATIVDESEKAYKAAEGAAADLSPTHPIRLGLALNFSVFCYEIRGSAAKACVVAKKAFDEAIAELDNLKDAAYKDSTLIMQLLRDNLSLWSETESEAIDNVIEN